MRILFLSTSIRMGGEDKPVRAWRKSCAVARADRVGPMSCIATNVHANLMARALRVLTPMDELAPLREGSPKS